MARRILLLLFVAVFASCTAFPRATTRPSPTPFERQLTKAGVDVLLPRPGKAIIVNVPSFELVAVDDGQPVLRSRVIVGTTKNPTPLLDTYTRAVTFRPTWRPTPEMVASGEYEDKVWPSGRTNPLGLAAIRLHPGLLVYLHDTNARSLFERDYRALSHGCIRVQKWDELIAWLLDQDLDWVRATANGRRTIEVRTTRVPVHVVYSIHFPSEKGKIFTYPDVYHREVVTRGTPGFVTPPADDTEQLSCVTPSAEVE